MPDIPDLRKPATYGFCPKCGAPGYKRERRLNGNDECTEGHVYPSKSALNAKPILVESGPFTYGQKVTAKKHRHEEIMTFCCMFPGSTDAVIVVRGDGRLSETFRLQDLETVDG
jgi:hypothetical protein